MFYYTELLLSAIEFVLFLVSSLVMLLPIIIESNFTPVLSNSIDSLKLNWFILNIPINKHIKK